MGCAIRSRKLRFRMVTLAAGHRVETERVSAHNADRLGEWPIRRHFREHRAGRMSAQRRLNHAGNRALTPDQLVWSTRVGVEANSTITRKPGRLSSSAIRAPCNLTTAATRLSPSPLPGVVRLVSSRKNRVKTASRSSMGMPGPVSLTSRRARPFTHCSLTVSSVPGGV